MAASFNVLVMLMAMNAAAQGFSGPSAFSGFSSGYNVGSSSAADGDSAGSSAGAIFGASASLGFNPTHISRMFAIHGILAAVAFAFLFPFGAILIRVVPGRFSIWVHAGAQLLSYALFTAAFVIGVIYSKKVSFGEFNLFDNHHPIIGVVVFALLGIQPITGILHHMRYAATGGRTIVSYAHLWVGRIGIALGIINGGLGLVLAGATNKWRIAYGVVAGCMGFFWILAAFYGHFKRSRAPRGSSHPAEGSVSSRSMSDSPYAQKEAYAKRGSQAGSKASSKSGSKAGSQAKSQSSGSSKTSSKGSKK